MRRLKPLSKAGRATALQMAERYRLLGEPSEAESICLDVLDIDPDDQEALVTLVLALTEQFGEDVASRVGRARQVLPKLHDEYTRAYYAGLICERWAKAHLQHGGPGAGLGVHDLLREAMAWYETAEAIRPPCNDDAVLRWNACTRLLQSHPELIREYSSDGDPETLQPVPVG